MKFLAEERNKTDFSSLKTRFLIKNLEGASLVCPQTLQLDLESPSYSFLGGSESC